MRIGLLFHGLAIALLALSGGTPAVDARADGDAPDWWQTERDVTTLLFNQKANFVDVLAKATTSKPATARDAMFKLNVLMRAGMNQQAIEALDELKEVCPKLKSHQVISIYHLAVSHEYSAWYLAQGVLDTFAANLSGGWLVEPLANHLLKSGWSVERVDQWLASKPPGIKNFWIKERLRFNLIHGLGDELVKQLADRVKKNPRDVQGAIAFLDVLVFAGQANKTQWDLSWMAELIQPQRTTDDRSIADALQILEKWAAAAAFYRRAIDVPLTEEELRQLALMNQMVFPRQTMKAIFEVNVRMGLAKCLLESGRNAEAQKWMVEANDICVKHHLSPNMLLAGRVQCASGQRVIEKRIKAKEEKSKDDPEYWLQRARYYCGRNKPAKEEEALKAALAIVTPKPAAAKPIGKGISDRRSRVLADYVHFLKRNHRSDEAVALLHKEIEQAPTSLSAERAASRLVFDFRSRVRPDDEVLWNFLAGRAKWGYVDERLLWKMLENAKPDDLGEYFSRAEALARDKDPSRSFYLGWVMNRMDFPGRSIPLLEYAVENAEDLESKGTAALTLYESYLDLGDWKLAEELFPLAAKRLTAREIPQWYSQLAVAAARAGAKDDTLRIWKVVANVNPSRLGNLDALAKAGLKDELAAFYREMKKQMPLSSAPFRALTILERNNTNR